MVSPFEDFAEGLTKLHDVDSIWEHTATFAHDLGFSGCSLTLACETSSGLKSDYLKTDISDDMKKIAEDDIQKLTDTFVKTIDETYAVKEVEIMKV